MLIIGSQSKLCRFQKHQIIKLFGTNVDFMRKREEKRLNALFFTLTNIVFGCDVRQLFDDDLSTSAFRIAPQR